MKKTKIFVKPTFCTVKNISHEEKITFCPKREGLFIPLKIQDNYRNFNAEIDSGSSRSIINPSILKEVGELSNLRFRKVNDVYTSITGHSMQIKYQVKLKIKITNFKSFYIWFLISDHADSLILGRDFLFNQKCTISFDKSRFTLQFKETKKNYKVKFVNKDLILAPKKISKIKIDTTNIMKGFYSIKCIKISNNIETLHGLYKITPEDNEVEILVYNNNEVESHLKSQDVYLLLVPEQIYTEKIAKHNLMEFQLSSKPYINDKFFAKTFFNRKNPNIFLYNNLKDTIEYNPSKACEICLKNISFDMLHIIDLEQYHLDHCINNMPNKTLNEVEKIKLIKNIDSEVNQHFEGGLAELHVDTPLPRKQLLELITEKTKHIPGGPGQKLWNTLVKLDNISRNGQYNDRHIKNAELDLNFKCPLPKLTKIYNINSDLKPALFHTLQTLVYHGLLERAGHMESYGSPLFVKRKKDSNKLRLLVDLRAFNACISESPQAGMTDCAAQIKEITQNARWISQIDLSQAFYSIPYSKKTFESGFSNILTCFGTFKARFCIQGTSMAPTFLDSYLHTELEKNEEGDIQPIECLLRHFDDIHVYNGLHDSQDEHIDKVIQLLNRLAFLGLHININKCQFSIDLTKNTLDILGYTVSHNKMSIPKDKYFKIKNALIKPNKIRDLQSIIGILSYFRQLFNSEQLEMLAKLSDKIKDKKLSWDSEGDYILNTFRKSFENEQIFVEFPSSQSLCVLYTDASEVSGGGILRHAPLSALTFADAEVPRNLPLDDFQCQHSKKFGIKYTNISEYLSLAEVIVYVFKLYTYNEIENENLNLKNIPVKYNTDEKISVLNKVINSGYNDVYNRLHFEGEDSKVQYKNFVKFIINLQNEEMEHYFTAHYLLRSISHALNRTLILIIKDMTHKPYIKISNMDGYKAPIVIYYDNQIEKYRLMGLLNNYDNLQKFNIYTLEKISSDKTFAIFNRLYKENPNAIRTGPVYRKKWSPTEKNLSIPLKELYAIYYSLFHFDDVIKSHNILVACDSLCVLQQLKPVSSRERKKFNLHSLLITSKYPNLKLCHVSGKSNIADYLTRLSELHVYNEIENEKKTTIKQITVEDLCDKTAAVFNKYTSFDNIARKTLEYHPEMYKDVSFTIKNNLLIKNDKIFLPDFLIDIFILEIHSKNGHIGQEKTAKILNSKYIFTKTASAIKEKIKNILSVCVACMTRKPNNQRYRIGSHISNEYKIGDVLALDYLELEKAATSTNFRTNAILVCTEIVSGHTTLYFHTKISAEECCRSLLTYMISNNKPIHLWTDNASVFTGATFSKFLKYFRINRLKSSPQHSSSRGKIENHIKILRFLVRLIRPNDSLEDFPLLCVSAANLLNNLPKDKDAPVDFTPLNIYKFGIFRNMDKNLKYNDFLNHLDLNAQQMEVFGEKLRKEVEKRKKRLLNELEKKNKNRIHHKFKVGQLALVKEFSMNKLRDKYYKNPYRIIKVNKFILTLADPITKLQIIRHVKDCKILKLKNIDVPDEILSEVPIYSSEYIKNLNDTPPPQNPPKRQMRLRPRDYNPAIDDNESSDDDDDKIVTFDMFT